MKIKSKVNGLIIGQSKTTNEVVKLGRGKYADVVSETKSKSQSKRIAAQKKAPAKTQTQTETKDEVEQL